MEAHGGLISTARACSQFLRGYWLNGSPRDATAGDFYFFGSLPGTYALARQRPDGVNITVLMNQRAEDDSYSIIKAIMDSAADSIITWPTIDLEHLVASSPRIGIDHSGGRLRVPTEKGRIYQVQGTVDLVNWFDVGIPQVGDGTQLSMDLPIGGPSPNAQMFFRVRIE